MIHNSDSEYVRFCWFRESAAGHIEQDGGLGIVKSDLLLTLLGLHPAQQRTTADPPVTLEAVLAVLSGATPLETLPLWSRKRLIILFGPLATEENRGRARENVQVMVRLAGRALSTLPLGLETELHLPYIDRRGWVDRFQILDNTTFTPYAGRLVPSSLLASGGMDEYNAQVLTVSSAHPGLTTGLAFARTQNVSRGFLEHLLPAVEGTLLELPEGDAQVEIRLSLDAQACRAWNTAAKETSGAYFPTHAPVSVAVQAALRRWLAWYWLTRVEHFADTAKAFTVLAYLVSAPFPGRRRTDFTHDTLTSEWMEFAFRHSRRPLVEVLNRISSTLLAAGHTDLAGIYHPREAKTILDKVRKERKSIRSLVAAEGDLVNHILKFGLQVQGIDDAIQVVHGVPELVRGMGSRLRRLFNEQDLTWLGSVLLIEATNALWVAQGGAPAIQTWLQIRPLPQSPSQC